MSMSNILYRYADALYCAAMLGGESGEQRAKNGLIEFKADITKAAKSGISAADTTLLLDRTLTMNSDVFLFALKTTGDFKAFSALLDKYKSEVHELRNPTKLMQTRQTDFFRTVFACNTAHLPDPKEFDCYLAMRDMMLAKSDKPDARVMADIIDNFDHIQATQQAAVQGNWPPCNVL